MPCGGRSGARAPRHIHWLGLLFLCKVLPYIDPPSPQSNIGRMREELLGNSQAIDRMLHHRAVSKIPGPWGGGMGERDVDRKTTYDVACTGWFNILSMCCIPCGAPCIWSKGEGSMGALGHSERFT